MSLCQKPKVWKSFDGSCKIFDGNNFKVSTSVNKVLWNIPTLREWGEREGDITGVKNERTQFTGMRWGEGVRSEVERTHFVILFKVQRFVLSVGSSCKLVSLSLYSCPRMSRPLIGRHVTARPLIGWWLAGWPGLTWTEPHFCNLFCDDCPDCLASLQWAGLTNSCKHFSSRENQKYSSQG